MILIITTSQDPLLGKKLVEKKLAGCASRDEIISWYWWEGKLVEDKEYRYMIKTTKELKDKAIEELKKMHDYSTPEILVMDVEANPEYLKWLKSVVG